MMSKTISTLILLTSTVSINAFGGDQQADRVNLLKSYYKAADARPFDADVLKSFLSVDLIDHNKEPGHDGDDISIVTNTFSSLAQGAPDSKHQLVMVEPVGKNKVLIYWNYQGTHTGELLGIPATNRKFDFAGMEIYKVDNGKISEIWHIEEIPKMLHQLGIN